MEEVNGKTRLFYAIIPSGPTDLQTELVESNGLDTGASGSILLWDTAENAEEALEFELVDVLSDKKWRWGYSVLEVKLPESWIRDSRVQEVAPDTWEVFEKIPGSYIKALETYEFELDLIDLLAEGTFRPDPKELALGIEVELEHTSSRQKARQIAIEHLQETPDYYTRLHKAGLAAETGHTSRNRLVPIMGIAAYALLVWSAFRRK